MFRFTIRELLILTVTVGLAMGTVALGFAAVSELQTPVLA